MCNGNLWRRSALGLGLNSAFPVGTHLVVSQAQITTESVVLQNLLLQLLYARFVFELLVCREETLVKLDDLSKTQMLSRCNIETSCYLYDLDQ